ncbi:MULTISPECIES: hypothetical protein [Methanobacterium]|uniref:Uncharacterized protein n=1 Tax=Methanobacterium bryantii TaxID=2161 RepID=A0A2A2H908_METBR|nr:MULTISPECIES: hypothetical protein [Methanobacterium]OEC87893.1 hypothetical protein A9507_06875 [Methanobacterium sp. A39]PAV05760.1 hypothetical protein ASJ80_08485 [Methanobacterium bryantii]
MALKYPVAQLFRHAGRVIPSKLGEVLTELDERITNAAAGILAAGSVSNTELADNAVDYKKLDVTGRKYKIKFNRSTLDTAGTDFELPIEGIDFAGTVKSVKILADAAFGQATNYSSLDIQNKTQSNASIASMSFNSTNTVSQWVPKALTLSATPANLNVAVGDALTLVKTHTGDGQALPTNFIVELVIERTA